VVLASLNDYESGSSQEDDVSQHLFVLRTLLRAHPPLTSSSSNLRLVLVMANVRSSVLHQVALGSAVHSFSGKFVMKLVFGMTGVLASREYRSVGGMVDRDCDTAKPQATRTRAHHQQSEVDLGRPMTQPEVDEQPCLYLP
jgi:hypothetical protein